MSGVVIFAGTSEGRLLAETLKNTALTVHFCVATDYGASLLPDCANIKIHTGRMGEAEMTAFLKRVEPDFCLDATHPYAVEVTANIRRACGCAKITCIRVLREEQEQKALDESKQSPCLYVGSIEEAAAFLNGTKGKILLTTGSRDLENYTAITDYRNRCVARVLPTAQVMEKCARLGFEGKNLIGMQGPFSEDLNYWMLKQVKASWLVTKSSGKEGGFAEKCQAAGRAGVSVLVIGRPPEPVLEGDFGEGGASEVKRMDLPEAVRFLTQYYKLDIRRKVYLIAMGPGNPALLTAEARELLRSCDVVIGARRILEICPDTVKKPAFEGYRGAEIAAYLNGHPQYLKAAILFSGDIGFYSGAKGIEAYLSGYEIHRVTGISSSVYFLNRLGIPWDEAVLTSRHGQARSLIPLIRRHKWVCTLLGETDTVAKTCAVLAEFKMECVRITVGERLSYPDENFITGNPSDLLELNTSPLSIALFENPYPQESYAAPGIRDSAFLRGRAPMTKEEIRSLSLAKLGLLRDSILYDVGAGTGSVSVEAALQCDAGMVYAAEKNKEAVSLIYENRRQFQTENLTVVCGTAPECLKPLPAPTHAFIGGSSGKMLDIIREIRSKNPAARFVVTAVTLETIALAVQIKSQYPEYEDMEIIMVQVSRSRPLGGYHLMSAENPVYIISFGPAAGFRADRLRIKNELCSETRGL